MHAPDSRLFHRAKIKFPGPRRFGAHPWIGVWSKEHLDSLGGDVAPRRASTIPSAPTARRSR